ncbi:MAG: acyl-CoA/acyl-ACP dehydrogenase [Kordiimonadaceae bacterium]|nr:acyl-CoA/acyl-ACP dehydrogenase [Kordiimonadaceae bacterium]
MDLLPNEEQQQIIEAIGGFMTKEMPLQRLYDLSPDGPMVERSAWEKMAELGWIGLGLEEEHGGVGYTIVEEVLLFREVGRWLVSPSLLASVIAARVLAISGNEALAQAVLSGKSTVCLSVPLGEVVIGPTVSGQFQLYDAADADYILCVNEQGASLVEASSLQGIKTMPCLDETLSLAVVTLEDTPAVARLTTAQDDIMSRVALLNSAMLLGIAETSAEMATEYAKLREQFGKPIGSFQAIKHMCSEMAVRAEAARSQTFYAALTMANNMEEAGFQIDAARILTTSAAYENTAANIQIHGGIGFTAEHTPHFYVKRAHVLDQLLGGSRRYITDILEKAAPL